MHALVQVAGGARGTDRIEDASVADWQWMFDANVLASQRLVAGLLPLLRRAAAADGHADTIFVTSTAAQSAYAGGAGYNAAKAAEGMLVKVLRQELNGEPIRESSRSRPAWSHTEEFTLNRLGGDAVAAEAVYSGVEAPLLAEDVADVIAYALESPGHVNLDLITMRPVAQSAQHLLARGPLARCAPSTDDGAVSRRARRGRADRRGVGRRRSLLFRTRSPSSASDSAPSRRRGTGICRPVRMCSGPSSGRWPTCGC